MKIHISTTNDKLGHSIPSVNLPPVLTCRNDAPCMGKCYARKGRWLFKNVKNSLQSNLDAYREDPQYFFDYIAINTRLYRAFRWHSAGDIVDARYLEGMAYVAKKNPKTDYLCFTKKFDLVNAYVDAGNEIPENLHIVFSGWDSLFKVNNPHDFPTTWVAFKKKCNEHIPEGSIPCQGHCEQCLACWSLQKGQSVYFDEH